MSEGMIGADPAQLRELAKSMSDSGNKLDAIAQSLGASISQTGWRGADSEQFRQRWSTILRPIIRTNGSMLGGLAKELGAQADEQEKTSAADDGWQHDGGGPGFGQRPADDRDWSNAWTDPNYEHAPGGVEFLWNFMSEGGGAASGITNALKFVADKFASTLGFGVTPDDVTRFSSGVLKLTKGLAWLGIGLGALDIISGAVNQDVFRIADGSVAALLGAATILTLPLAATGVGAVVPAILGVAGLAWGLAGMISGDVPVSKRIWDAGAGLVGWVGDLAGGT